MIVSERAAEDPGVYLHAHQRKGLLRFITCGSVDDGKSTLIGRLRLDPPDLDLPLTDDLLQEVVGFKPFDRLGIDPETARPELVGSGILGDAPGSVDQLADGFAQVLGDSALRRDLAACAAVRGPELFGQSSLRESCASPPGRRATKPTTRSRRRQGRPDRRARESTA